MPILSRPWIQQNNAVGWLVMKKVKIGDIIYIETSLYVSHGVDDIIGGKTKVIKVIEEPDGTVLVWTELEPDTRYNWEMLSEDQETLKKAFGDDWAYRKPDCRPEFNSFY